MNFKELKKDLLFLPLGGSGEIGMNLNMYHYLGKWLIVDMGIGFADANFPGVEIIVPNIDFILERKKDILAMILTHAHEDHIGGVQYLWPEIQIPIYTNAFTGAVLRSKLHEFGLANKVPVQILNANLSTKIGPFDIELVNITHSIVENNGIMIRTEAGNIFHTGDWKIDEKPVLGELTDIKRLKELGNEGVLAMVGDSTNIFNVERSGSEGDLEKSLANLIKERKKGMVVVTTFASNVARLHSIAKAASKAGRKVILAGRSLWRMYKAAKECGYLSDIADFAEDKEIKKMNKDEVLVISTGCQGEPLAAVNKIASGSHPNISLGKGDAIIFSSKIIPGNDKKIYELFNKFCKTGVEVFTEKDHFVHVSGHPGQEEVALMYKYLKPRISIPVHGEAVHIHAHAKFAKLHGCKYTFEVSNGDVLKISEDGVNKVGRVNAGYVLIDGESMLDEESPVIKSRRKIRDNGALFITLKIAKGKPLIIKSVQISAPGLLDFNTDSNFINVIKEEVLDYRLASNKDHDIEKEIITLLKRFVKKELNKFPDIQVHICE